MPKRVLVVDDAIFMRNKIKSILEGAATRSSVRPRTGVKPSSVSRS